MCVFYRRTSDGDKSLDMILALAIAACAFSGASPAAFILETGDSVWDVATVDANGDGRNDVAAFCTDEGSVPLRKYLALFFARPDGGYPSKPSAILSLDPAVGAGFFAEIDGQAPKEFIAASQSFLRYYRFADGSFEEAGGSDVVSLLPTGSKEPSFLRKAVFDVDGDGVDEWLIPVPGGYELHGPSARLAKFSCHMSGELRQAGSGYVINRLPAHQTFRLPGQDRLGFAFLSDEIADFYFGKDWAEHRSFKVPFSLDQKWESGSRIDDIDGDGFPDLIITQTQGTIRLRVTTHVYLSSAPFEYPSEATAIFETTGALTNPALRDVNGDGKLDLVFVSLPFGIKSLLNYFLRDKLSVNVEVHLFENGGYSTKPSFKTGLLLDAPEGRERVAFALGDFTGDGRLDAAYGSGKNTFAVYAGEEDRLVSSRPWASFEMPSFGEARPTDLDGKNGRDLILFHPSGIHKKRIEVILF